MTAMVRQVVVADACVLINLLATRRAGDLLDALGWSLVATPQAASQVKYLAGPPDDEGRATRESVDCSSMQATGHLVVRTVPPQSVELFVRCAAEIHEADASSIALADGLGVVLATDDTVERRIAERERPALGLTRTLAIVKEAVGKLGLDERQLNQLAMDLRTRGNFLPPRSDPDGPWFASLLRAAQSSEAPT